MPRDVEQAHLDAVVLDGVEAVHLRVEHDAGFEFLDFFFYVSHFPHNENSLTHPQKIATFFFTFFKKTFLIFLHFRLDT